MWCGFPSFPPPHPQILLVLFLESHLRTFHFFTNVKCCLLGPATSRSRARVPAAPEANSPSIPGWFARQVHIAITITKTEKANKTKPILLSLHISFPI